MLYACIPKLLPWITALSIIIIQPRWHMHHYNILFLLVLWKSSVILKKIFKPINLQLWLSILTICIWLTHIDALFLEKFKSVKGPINRIDANDAQIVIKRILVPASTFSSHKWINDICLSTRVSFKMSNISWDFFEPKVIQKRKLGIVVWNWFHSKFRRTIIIHIIIVPKSRNDWNFRKLWLNKISHILPYSLDLLKLMILRYSIACRGIWISITTIIEIMSHKIAGYDDSINVTQRFYRLIEHISDQF
jgi:hypothetical protein